MLKLLKFTNKSIAYTTRPVYYRRNLWPIEMYNSRIQKYDL